MTHGWDDFQAKRASAELNRLFEEHQRKRRWEIFRKTAIYLVWFLIVTFLLLVIFK